MMQTQDAERRHIARELHDSAGQTLAVLGMNIARLAENANYDPAQLAKEIENVQDLVKHLLRGHPKPAIQGHLQSGHTEGMDCGREPGCGKAGSCAALEIAPRFPLSHNLNNNITLSVGQ
jgi:hypothetical protein